MKKLKEEIHKLCQHCSNKCKQKPNVKIIDCDYRKALRLAKKEELKLKKKIKKKKVI